ncbi:hypothetical protein DBW_0899 [Desulfuromonas sp. DDH964]|nr:hypothetical protein DBW_0899 [Desulfuromonas sp. DDH964]
MKRSSQMLGYSHLSQRIWGLFVALMCITVLAGCSGDDKTVIQNLPTATTGSLNVNVSPATATVVVTAV